MLFVHEVFGLALVMKFQIFLTFVGYNLRMCLTKHIFLRDNQGGGVRRISTANLCMIFATHKQ